MAENENGQERTEEATARKREEAREKGQVALSQDVVSALSLGVASGALIFGGSALAEAAGGLVRESVANMATIGTVDMPLETWSDLVSASTRSMVLPVAMIVAPLLITGIFAGYAQVGFQFSPKALEWDIARMSPAKGWQKIAGVRGAARTLQSAFKIFFVGAAAIWATWSSVDELPMLAGAPLGVILTGLGGLLARVAGAAIGTFAFLALVDVLYQRWQHDQDLRMTREEVRQELKNSEGDPQLKARVRESQRRMARQRMMFDVPTASVVITNPTHVAVALRWNNDAPEDNGGPGAPVVVAKGVDFVAQRIKEVAREAGVPLREDVPLARAIHAQCEIGDEIPAGLYQAVAAVLAQVWSLAPEPGKGA